ncbi:MAG: plasminogen-binding N-terminal domain-containing protein [Campylobacterales bacterium]|nr:plasminogen-binding N-terminal domain-containing protein [Campylobacterales bacterium]
MHKIATLFLAAFPLFGGFFPPTVQSAVSSVSGKQITLTKPFPINGMSGVIVHTYNDSLPTMTHRIAQTSTEGKAKLIETDIIHHESLPNIKTEALVGDKVVGGYLYDNVLVLAPDAQTYSKITSQYEKTWIHPDLYALFLTKEGDSVPTKENLAKFADMYQVGLVCIVRKETAILLDPISGKIVGQQTLGQTPAQGQFPFFMHFEEIKSGWFDSEEKGNYYQIMESI